jgi:hypothetical protein
MTVDVHRETVSCRLLDPQMTDEDRDFIRAAVVSYPRGNLIRFEASERLVALLKIPIAVGLPSEALREAREAYADPS